MTSDEHAPPSEPQPEPPPPRASYPFWNYEDLALFIGMIFPAIALSFLAISGGAKLFPRVFGLKAIHDLGAQLLLYALLFFGLWQIFRLRYGQPLLRSLEWRYPFRGSWQAILIGPSLAVLIAALGTAFKAPVVRNTFEGMLEQRWEVVLVGVFAVILGPLAEELVFRGFILPLLASSLGAPAGVLLTAFGFAMLHGPQYSWSWQHLLLVGSAGVVFGIMRIRTGSTVAAFLMHATYNLTFFAAYLVQIRNTFPEPI